MFHDILFLTLGLVLIILGGNYVTNGSVAVAQYFKVPSLIIGLTVVAFGSSTPDLVVSVTSTLHGKYDLALGDIVGAVIFDMLLVVGITALIRPVKISRSSMKFNIPVLVAAALFIFACADDRLLDHSLTDTLTRSDGIAMLVLFAVFLYYTFHSRKDDTSEQDTAAPAKRPNMWIAAISILGGLCALVVGGQWIVSGASGIALKAGWSEAMIGLTIVGIGSSLPDLATSVVAAFKGETGIAMGNVIGACIMDILFVIGTCATIHPLQIGSLTVIDFATLAAAAIMIWVFAAFPRGKATISRTEGAILALGYVAYAAYLVMSA